tara:strand:- start:2748 stop:3995 length:1248 start_codon:yes stop_codon:yes gene_type:complete
MNICFLVNISDGVGHILIEPENFLMKLHLGEIEVSKRYIFIKKPHYLSDTIITLYGHKFWLAISNTLLYNLVLPITLRYTDITLDCGLSRLKWQTFGKILPRTLRYGDITLDSSLWRSKWQSVDKSDYDWFLFKDSPRPGFCGRVISKNENLHGWSNYFKRRKMCANYLPMKDEIKEHDILPNNELLDLLIGNTEKIALIHLRTNLGNAAARLTDPLTYLDTLAYLTDMGYQMIFVGREKMPDVFRPYGLIDYPRSGVATFKNDIILFNLADIVITAASGICFLAACYGTPLVYLNGWHIFRPPYSKDCVIVPALVKNNSGKFLTFIEQWKLYYSIDEVAEVFPSTHYKGRDASSDEILEATKELFSLNESFKERSEIEERFMKIVETEIGLLSSLESRWSHYFLTKHSNLFGLD